MPVMYEKRGQVGIVTLSRPEARNAWGPDFSEGIAHHFTAMERAEWRLPQVALEATEDKKEEGHAAWREKRKPVFRGR